MKIKVLVLKIKLGNYSYITKGFSLDRFSNDYIFYESTATTLPSKTKQIIKFLVNQTPWLVIWKKSNNNFVSILKITERDVTGYLERRVKEIRDEVSL